MQLQLAGFVTRKDAYPPGFFRSIAEQFDRTIFQKRCVELLKSAAHEN